MDIFSKNPVNIEAFELFGKAHLVTALVMILFFSVMTIIAKRSTWFAASFRKYLLVSLVLQEIFYRMWVGFYQGFYPKDFFSLHISSVSVWLSIYLLISYRQKVFDVMYFWGLLAVPMAVITPGLVRYGFPHFRFFHNLLVHITVIFVIIYFLFIEKRCISKGANIRTIVITNIYGAFVFVVNLVFDTNYMFTGRKITAASLLDFLGPWPYYIVVLDVIMVVLCCTAYLPFYYKYKRGTLKP